MLYHYLDGSTYENKSIKDICNSTDKIAEIILDENVKKELLNLKKQFEVAFEKEKSKSWNEFQALSGKELFKQDYFLNRKGFRIHFMIPNALKLIECGNYKRLNDVDCSLFTTKTDACSSKMIKYSDIKISKTETDFFSALVEPIILIPYYYGAIQYLVIDGNHRVTAKITEHKPINCYVVNPLDNISVFTSEAEKYYYMLNRFAGELPANVVNTSALL